jgi:hypothetical protein
MKRVREFVPGQAPKNPHQHQPPSKASVGPTHNSSKPRPAAAGAPSSSRPVGAGAASAKPLPRAVGGADDLDGDFAPFLGIPEGEDAASSSSSSDNDDDNIDGVAAGAGAAPAADGSAAPAAATLSKRAAKKRRQLERLKAAKAAEAATVKRGEEAQVASLTSDTPAMQAEAFWTAYAASAAGKNLSALELGDPVPASAIVPFIASAVPVPAAGGASAGAGASSVNAVDDVRLPAIVRAALPNWRQVFGWKHGAAPRPKASPALVIVSPSARRAADLLKPLAVFNARIGKCFAKHISVEEQTQMLNEGPPIAMAVGTPHRLKHLLDVGAMSLSSCVALVWDLCPDPKGFTVLTSFATRDDCFLLFKDHIRPLIKADGGAGVGAGATGAASAGGKGRGNNNNNGNGIRMAFLH